MSQCINNIDIDLFLLVIFIYITTHNKIGFGFVKGILPYHGHKKIVPLTRTKANFLLKDLEFIYEIYMLL